MIDVFTTYELVKPLKDRKAKTVLCVFTETVYESKRKAMLKWLDDNDILMYCIYNKGNSVVAERLVRALKSKISKKSQLIIKNIQFFIWMN